MIEKRFFFFDDTVAFSGENFAADMPNIINFIFFPFVRPEMRLYVELDVVSGNTDTATDKDKVGDAIIIPFLDKKK